MSVKIIKLLNLIRFRIIGTIFLAITITDNAIEATAPNVDYRFIIPILVMGGVLLTPLIRGRRIVKRIYRRGINQYNSRLTVCILMYSNNVPIWILCISMIIAIYKILKLLYS